MLKSNPLQKTRCHKFIATAFAAACCILIPANIYANGKSFHSSSGKTTEVHTNIPDVLVKKVKCADLTDTEMKELYENLLDQGFDHEDISYMADLKTNSQGLTYGVEPMNPDLILVTSDHGINGYCYSDELNIGTGFSSPEEALAWQEEFYNKYTEGYKIPVYEKDGKTLVDYFTIGRISEKQKEYDE